jgi:hypothetical protein
MQPPLVDNAWTIHAAGIIPEPRRRPLGAGGPGVGPAIEARTEDLPHRRKDVLLVTGSLGQLLELHLQLADEVERELADDAP